MIKVAVSREAQKDLVNIRQYISGELENPQAAKRIIHYGSILENVAEESTNSLSATLNTASGFIPGFSRFIWNPISVTRIIHSM